VSTPQLNIVKNQSLKAYNTFGIDVKANYFCEIDSQAQLFQLFNTDEYLNSANKLFLGGGSNILFTQDYAGIVIKVGIKGIRIDNNDENIIWVNVGAGENWHDFVLFCIENGLAGVENLSLIPGTVGAAPIQNIGAYGVELKDVLEGVEAIEMNNGLIKKFNAHDLKLGYRESIFKHEAKGKFIITSVTFKLSRVPTFNVSYGAINAKLEQNEIKELSIKAISDVVIQIRKSKLPNPAEIGNAGSFFKNPSIAITKILALQKAYPTIPNYPIDEHTTKIAAGWLIEQCGWKGKRVGNTGVHKDQALVLVNYGGASGLEIWNLAQEIIASVDVKFGIKLTPEVNVV